MPRENKRRKVIHDNDEKDVEEKQLESVLFGASYDFGVAEENGGNEMANLRDEDLFVVDDAPNPESESESESESEEPQSKARSAWVDPSDPTVSLSSSRLRKLRDTPNETELAGHEYERRLRRQFEKTFPIPAWAAKAREKTKSDEDEDENLESLVSSTAALTKGSLGKGTLHVSRLRDPLFKEKDAGCIKSLAWHPSRDVPLLAVGATDRRVRLYNIDGHTNPLVLTLHNPSLPLTSQSGLSWHPGGHDLLITGPRPYYHVYDMQSGSMRTVGGALLGSRFSSSPLKRSRTDRGDSDGFETTAFSPTGNILAIAGRGGAIHLVDWKAPGQVVGTVKVEGGGVAPNGLWWSGDGFLSALSASSHLHVFDIGERRCVRKWKDEGGWKGSARGVAGFASSDGKGLLTIGSNVGLVNVYDSQAFSPSTQIDQHDEPKPLKTLEQLTTPISTMRFNHDGRILAVSSEGKDKLRLYHTESLTPYTNFPTTSTPLGHLTTLGFSNQSEYLAMGNKSGRVLVYSLTAYSAKM